MTRTLDRARIGHAAHPLPLPLELLQRRSRAACARVSCDVGLWWREDADGPLHRAAWVSDTGELYLVRLGPPEEGGGEVELLASSVEHERLESVLEGWREQCGSPRSLTWLRERAAGLRADGAVRR